jgi:hypothetical protein
MEVFVNAVYTHEKKKIAAEGELHPYEFEFPKQSIRDFFKMWVDNPFVAKFKFAALYFKANFMRYKLKRFFIGCLRKRKESQNSTDFNLSPFTLPASSYFFLYEHGKKYTFSLPHAQKIVLTAITSNVEMILSPVQPTNPYTRQLFRPETIYLIFLKLVETGSLISPLLSYFVSCDCNLQKFTLRHEPIVREYLIERYSKNLSDPNTLRFEIRQMLVDIKVIPNAKSLPKTCLLPFKPWLKVYFTYLYSLNQWLRFNSFQTLQRAATEFLKVNKKFGTMERHIIHTEIESLPKPIFV